MREVRYPAKDVIVNEHGSMVLPEALTAKLDRAGIPVMNIVSQYGFAFGMHTYHYDALSEEVVFRWYEPGEKVPALQLADAEEVHWLRKKLFPKTRRAAAPATEEDDEL